MPAAKAEKRSASAECELKPEDDEDFQLLTAQKPKRARKSKGGRPKKDSDGPKAAPYAWSPAQDEYLLELYKEHGKDFALMTEKLNLKFGVTSKMVSNHWPTLSKRLGQ
ncbi:hypothetical protein HDU85_003715 [Gaertneriomyces sp. JEL0708]|nr:hypothetical protein HDU85_003715 [Gaertneriomyces sp. JEL0708]